MKKFTLLAVVVAAFFIAGSAMAASYTVTNNFGVRVTEKGVCEQIGSTTLAPAVDDNFTLGTVVTVELLGASTICYSFDYDLVDGILAYTVAGTAGDDYYTITVTAAGAIDEAIVFGDNDSPVCFDLSGTSYNSQDPNNQLVKVSYRDNMNNTYSGDIYVATVKPAAHSMSLCSKTQGDSIGADGWDYEYWDFALNKSGLPVVDFCYNAKTSQDQTTTECGLDYGNIETCITVDDPANVFANNEYDLVFTTEYAGVGISDVDLYDKNGNSVVVADATFYKKVTAPGPTNPAVVPGVGGVTWADIKRYEVSVPAIPSGRLYFKLNFAANTCVAVDGTLSVSVAMTRNPCGDSTMATLDVAVIDVCGDDEDPTSYSYPGLLPYFANLDSTWWSGLALTNVTDEDKTVTLSIYEADGDMYTCTVVVPADGIVADVFSATAYAGNAITTTSADAAFGDERFSVRFDNYYAIHGFALLGDGSQAQGYLSIPDWTAMPR